MPTDSGTSSSTIMPLQGLSCLAHQGSMLFQSKKRKCSECSSEAADMECTPTEFIQRFSPGSKHKRLFRKGKENDDGGQFVLARRSRRKKESTAGVSWDHLPEELFLRIFHLLPLQDLLRTTAVCKKWHRLALDDSLWHSVDLEGLTHVDQALQQILKTGVRRVRCPRSYIEEQRFVCAGQLQLLDMDLSSSIVPTAALESIICSCRLLENLSLEGLQLSDTVVSALAKNPKLQQLNLSGCSGFSPPALANMLVSCSSLVQLNISWCTFTNDHVRSVVNNLSPSVTHLNLSGYRENLTLDDVKVLVTRCPNIRILDLSDSTLLMADCFPVLKQLKHLLHLSLSRCYQIHLAAITDVGDMFPALTLLDMFGVVQSSHLPALKKGMPQVSINTRPFSSISRPTPAGRVIERTMWNRTCRLRFKL